MLAYSIAFNILPYKLYKTRPSELGSDKLVGLEITGVTGGLMVMATDEYRTAEGGIREDINAILVYQNSVDKLLVRKTSLENGRDVLQGQL